MRAQGWRECRLCAAGARGGSFTDVEAAPLIMKTWVANKGTDERVGARGTKLFLRLLSRASRWHEAQNELELQTKSVRCLQPMVSPTGRRLRCEFKVGTGSVEHPTSLTSSSTDGPPRFAKFQVSLTRSFASFPASRRQQHRPQRANPSVPGMGNSGPSAAIDARYCSTSPVKIQLQKIFLPNKLKFKDLGTGAVVFRTVARQTTSRDR